MIDPNDPTRLFACGVGGGVWRSISLALRNLFYEIGFTLASYLLNLIPPAIPVIPFVVFGIESYYAGFGLMDIVLERKNMTKQQTIDFVRRNKGLATGLGLPFMAMNFIPIIGWFLGPTLGTVAATTATLEALRESQVKGAA